jgi:hypothetical protein
VFAVGKHIKPSLIFVSKRSEAHEGNINNWHLQTLYHSLQSINDEEKKFDSINNKWKSLKLFFSAKVS